MSFVFPLLAQEGGGFGWGGPVLAAVAIFLVLFLGILAIVAMVYGKIWFQAYMSSADVTLLALVGMGFRQVNPRIIVFPPLRSRLFRRRTQKNRPSRRKIRCARDQPRGRG